MSIRVHLNRLTIDHDHDYGIDRRRGWSIAWRGSYCVQFERFLLVALVKTWWKARRFEV